jgi:alkylation response protein AidB-like acyl-CoA dehydrogenase
LEWLTLRALSEHGSAVAEAWPAGSVLHVLGSELQQKTGALMVEALGERAVVAYPEFHDDAPPRDYPPGPPHAPGITADFLYRRAVTIYGGSNEIQRNLIARHLLVE